MQKYTSIICLLVLTLIAGCGVYKFNPGGKATIDSVAINRFENQTLQFGLEDRMTDIVTDAFISDGTIKVLPPDAAESLLSAVLTRYELQPHEFDETDRVTRYRVVMGFDVTLTRRVNDSLLWQQNVTQQGIYEADTETEETGQERAIELLVEEIITRTTKSW